MSLKWAILSQSSSFILILFEDNVAKNRFVLGKEILSNTANQYDLKIEILLALMYR